MRYRGRVLVWSLEFSDGSVGHLIVDVQSFLKRFCPKIIYKLFAIAAVLAIKEAYSIQARCRLALASIRTLFG